MLGSHLIWFHTLHEFDLISPLNIQIIIILSHLLKNMHQHSYLQLPTYF